jgi:hypothetical protein
VDPVAHASIALIAKRINKSLSLPALIVGTQITDLLFFIFQFSGIEKAGTTGIDFVNGMKYNETPVINVSHSLLSAILITLIFFIISQLIFKKLRISLLISSMVLSHWILDFLVYWNLPVTFMGSTVIGLGLMRTGNGLIIGIGIEGLLVLTTIVVSILLIFRRNKN